MRKYIEESVDEAIANVISAVERCKENYEKLVSTINEGIEEGYITPPPEWAEFLMINDSGCLVWLMPPHITEDFQVEKGCALVGGRILSKVVDEIGWENTLLPVDALFSTEKDNKGDKPSWSEAPECANYLAQDADGTWYWYEYEPTPFQVNWLEDEGWFGMAKSGNPNSNWEHTLEKRP